MLSDKRLRFGGIGRVSWRLAAVEEFLQGLFALGFLEAGI